MPKMAMIVLASAGTISLVTASYLMGRYGWPRVLRTGKSGASEQSMGQDGRANSSWLNRLGLARFGMTRRPTPHPPTSSGNLAFDEYRIATMRWLEDEQAGFSAFLEKLRRAKDAQEFDEFMHQRRTVSAADVGEAQ